MIDALDTQVPAWQVVVGALAVSYALNVWFIARLVRSLDMFKQEARKLLRQHGEAIVAIEARHYSEDKWDGEERRRERERVD